MRRAIAVALVVAVALVFLNDAGRWVNAQSQLNESTTQLAQWAATNIVGQDRNAAARIVSAEGAKRGISVYQYDQDQTTVRVWSSVAVRGTWLVGPYVAITKGTPIDQARGAPFVVKSYQQAQFQ
jgi:hypothetical protein